MRYRIAILGLAAVLGVLPALTITPAAPLPKGARKPEIYALIYVGLGKNHPGNLKRIKAAIDSMSGTAHRAFSDPKVRALPIVQDKEKQLGTIERNKWGGSKIRATSLEGTAVVRVWFTDGTPQEQVLIVNAFAREFADNEQELSRDALERQQHHKKRFKIQQEQAGVKVTEKDEREFRRQEEVLKHPPHVIEWASIPDKP
jgi:hypothetical protein